MAERGTAGENLPRIVPPPPAIDPLKVLQYFSWVFLTFQVAVAISRSINDPSNLAFVVGSYLNLLLLFWSLRRFEKAREGSPERNSLRYVVWLLASSLILTFSYKSATIMPMVMKVIVWAMAVLATSGGFYVLILCSDK